MRITRLATLELLTLRRLAFQNVAIFRGFLPSSKICAEGTGIRHARSVVVEKAHGAGGN